ncbi:MAG: transcription antitermination factor NusB [Planctomycetes bacterium]|nr:transcription antitermination factor NusB [Planctomycetota bacterium]
MTTRRRAREVTLQVLYEEDINPLRELSTADQFVAKRMLQNKPLVAFAKELLYGVRNHRQEIDKLLSKHAANWSIKRMTTIDRNILRISTYEIVFGDIPGRVSINEAIELAKRYGHRNSPLFVNGILDRILKEHEKSDDADARASKELTTS